MRVNEMTEYQVEYDTDLGCFWVSGLTPEGFWIETDFIQVFDDPLDAVDEYVFDLRQEGYYVDVFDITDEDDEYVEEDEETTD